MPGRFTLAILTDAQTARRIDGTRARITSLNSGNLACGHRCTPSAGAQVRESTGQTGRAGQRAADRLLKKRWQDIGRGRFIGPSEDRVLLTDLLDAVKTDYELNVRRSSWTLAYRLQPLRTAFAGERAVDVTEERIARYTTARLAEGYAPASVNRELAALRRAFRLAVRQKRLSVAPTITLLVENNARKALSSQRRSLRSRSISPRPSTT